MSEDYNVVYRNADQIVINSAKAEFHIKGQRIIYVKPFMGFLEKPVDELRIPCTFHTDQGVLKINTIDGCGVLNCQYRINRVILEDGISEISDNAFVRANIDEMVWPKSCISIPRYCFQNSKIRRIYGVEDVVEIGASAFQRSSIEEFHWPQKVKEIPKNCFADCCNLNVIDGLDNIFSVDEKAFCNASQIENIEFGNELKSIKSQAFSDCKNLKSIQWGTSIKKICSKAFYNSSLEEIGQTKTITSIGPYAFAGCHLKSFAWPEKCRDMKDSVFYNCISLSQLTGLEKVRSIGSKAFAYCYSLKDFTVPEEVTLIPDDCFVGSGLSNIQGLDHVTSIGEGAFSGADLTNCEWPINCHEIRDRVFANCCHLEEVRNLTYVQSVGKKAFAGCIIVKLDMSDSVCCSIGQEAFLGVDPNNVSFPYFIMTEDMPEFFKQKGGLK